MRAELLSEDAPRLNAECQRIQRAAFNHQLNATMPSARRLTQVYAGLRQAAQLRNRPEIDSLIAQRRLLVAPVKWMIAITGALNDIKYFIAIGHIVSAVSSAEP